MTFSELLNEYNLTGYRVAKLSGIPQSTIAKMHSGQKEFDGMSVRNATKLANVFGMTVDEMYAKLEGKAIEKKEKLERFELKIGDEIITGRFYRE